VPNKSLQNLKVFWLKEYLKKKNRPSSTMGQTFWGNPFANFEDGELTDNEGEPIDNDLSSVMQGFSAMMSKSRDAFARMEARLAAMESGQQSYLPSTPYQAPLLPT